MGKRLIFKAARIVHGYSQSGLAIELGVSQQTIAKYETGKSLPRDFTAIRRIAAILEAKPQQLFPDLYGGDKIE